MSTSIWESHPQVQDRIRALLTLFDERYDSDDWPFLPSPFARKRFATLLGFEQQFLTAPTASLDWITRQRDEILGSREFADFLTDVGNDIGMPFPATGKEDLERRLGIIQASYDAFVRQMIEEARRG